MTPWIFDRRAMYAGALALTAVVIAFVGSFWWLQTRVMTVHVRETYSLLDQDLRLRQRLDELLGRQTLTQTLQVRRAVLPEAPSFVLVDARGTVLAGDLGAVPGGREVLSTSGLRMQIAHPDGSHSYVVARRLADGAALLISRRDNAAQDMAWSLGLAGLAATLVVVLVGLLAGYVFNRFVLEHVSGLAAAARDIQRGQMAARAPAPARQRLDALGALTSTVNEMLDQNEALVGGMRTVTESLAHDLRAPLMRVGRAIGSARAAADESVREVHLRDAEAEASRALQTFNALVDLARAEAGLSRDAMERVDVGALTTDLADFFGPLAEERGQRLECRIDACEVVAHRQILAQAVGNLLENAIKYAPRGTRLQLEVHALGRSGAEVMVRDEGPGIPAHAREQALRPFVRLEGSTRQPGAGLGLAIAAAVARLHRGRLLLEGAEPGLRVRLQLNPG
ncbi:MAG: sensor histidine kinase [Gammaproteobacteria bacterium]